MAELSTITDVDELYRELAIDIIDVFLSTNRKYMVYDVKSKPFNKIVQPKTWTDVTMNNVARELESVLEEHNLTNDVQIAILSVKPPPKNVGVRFIPHGAQGRPFMVSKFALIKAPHMYLHAA